MITPIRPEQLKHRINIQQDTGTQDESWVDYLTNIYSFVDPTGGSEFYAAQKVNSEANCNVWIRYHTGITPSMRVVFGTRCFNILAVLDIQERKRWIRLVCKEVV